MSFVNDFDLKGPLSDNNPLTIFGLTTIITITVYLEKIVKVIHLVDPKAFWFIGASFILRSSRNSKNSKMILIAQVYEFQTFTGTRCFRDNFFWGVNRIFPFSIG